MNRSCSGYILILTLVMIASMISIGTYIFVRGIAYVSHMNIVVAREQAKLMALSGIQLGLSQLHLQREDQEDGNSSPRNIFRTEQLKFNIELFTTLFPHINKWQTHTLHKAVEGINAQISFCIVSEEGKINLNQIYDYTKKQFKGQDAPKGNWRKLMQAVCERIEKITHTKELFSGLEKVMSTRGYPFNDVTELLQDPSFFAFRDAIFYDQGSHIDTKNNKGDKEEKRIYLTDIFTVYPGDWYINPFFFSSSLKNIFNLKTSISAKDENSTEIVKKIADQLNKTFQWSTDWKAILYPVYQKELQSLPNELNSVLSTRFDPHWFAIFSYGTVGNVTQRVLAIVERNIRLNKDRKPACTVLLKKIYWL